MGLPEQTNPPAERITVAVPTYNRAPLLDRALAALEAQDMDPAGWAALVIDNNSTDGTVEIVQRYLARGRLPGLRYLSEPRQGLSFCRLRAVRESRTGLIAFVDDDCFLDPDWLRKAVEFCDLHPEAGAVGGRVDLLWEDSPPEEALRYSRALAQQDQGDEPCRLPQTGLTWLVGAGLVLQREALERSGWCDRWIMVGRKGRELSGGSDVEIVLRIRHAGFELWYNPAMHLVHYLPPHRGTIQYICRLNREQASALPVLGMLAAGRIPSLPKRVKSFALRAVALGSICNEIATHDFLARRRGPSTERRILFCQALGHMLGAFRALFVRAGFL
ncbi:MAG TPA: glycosyltransferase [Chloroflexota bacterium]